MKCDCHECDARKHRNIINNESSKVSTYRLDKMVSGQWERFKPYPHTIAGMDEAFQMVDDFISNRISSRVIDTETGETIMEINL